MANQIVCVVFLLHMTCTWGDGYGTQSGLGCDFLELFAWFKELYEVFLHLVFLLVNAKGKSFPAEGHGTTRMWSKKWWVLLWGLLDRRAERGRGPLNETHSSGWGNQRNESKCSNVDGDPNGQTHTQNPTSLSDSQVLAAAAKQAERISGQSKFSSAAHQQP